MEHILSRPTLSVDGKDYIQPHCSCGWQGNLQPATDVCPRTMALSDYFNHINRLAAEEQETNRKALAKRVIHMRNVEKKSYREISLATGVSKSTISVILSRATPAKAA